MVPQKSNCLTPHCLCYPTDCGNGAPYNSMEVHAEPAGEGLERGQRLRRSKELVWSALSSRRGSTTDIDAASKI